MHTFREWSRLIVLDAFHKGGHRIWIWVNLASPLCPSVSHYVLVSPSLFLMYFGNHGNNTALSIKATRCSISDKKTDGKSSAGTKSHTQKGKGHFSACDFTRPFLFLLSLTCFFSFVVVCRLFDFWQLWAVLKRVNVHSLSLKERAPSYPRHAFAASPSHKSPGSEMGARYHQAVECKFLFFIHFLLVSV